MNHLRREDIDMNWTALIGWRAAMVATATFDMRYARALLDLAFGAGVLAILPALPLERIDSLAILRCSLIDGFDKAAGLARSLGQSLARRAH
jgi:hypothetical protein